MYPYCCTSCILIFVCIHVCVCMCECECVCVCVRSVVEDCTPCVPPVYPLHTQCVPLSVCVSRVQGLRKGYTRAFYTFVVPVVHFLSPHILPRTSCTCTSCTPNVQRVQEVQQRYFIVPHVPLMYKGCKRYNFIVPHVPLLLYLLYPNICVYTCVCVHV